MSALERVRAWEKRGRKIATPDGAVWAMEAGPEPMDGGGVSTAIPVLLLHGFPTSSYDFAPLIDALSKTRRVIAFDFLGYGLSDKPASYGYSLFQQTDLVIAVAREFGVRSAHVVAHDVGTSVATELLARKERGLLPLELDSVVLMNGSVHIELSQLTVGQKLLRSPLARVFARLNSRTTFKAQLRQVLAKQPADEELEVMWELVARADGAARLPQLIGYVEERWRYAQRWIGALERCKTPVLVAWGRKDPVAIMAIADLLAREIPGAKRVTWDDLGHYPQVEDPGRVAHDVAGFLARLG